MKKRICLVLILTIISVCINISKCMAVDKDNELGIEQKQGGSRTIDPDDWNPANEINSTTMSNTVTEKVGKILGFIQAVGVIASVLAMMLIGLRTMFGSIEQKTAYKEAMPGYIIGIILVFSMTTIPNIIFKFMNLS